MFCLHIARRDLLCHERAGSGGTDGAHQREVSSQVTSDGGLYQPLWDSDGVDYRVGGREMDRLRGEFRGYC